MVIVGRRRSEKFTTDTKVFIRSDLDVDEYFCITSDGLKSGDPKRYFGGSLIVVRHYIDRGGETYCTLRMDGGDSIRNYREKVYYFPTKILITEEEAVEIRHNKSLNPPFNQGDKVILKLDVPSVFVRGYLHENELIVPDSRFLDKHVFTIMGMSFVDWADGYWTYLFAGDFAFHERCLATAEYLEWMRDV